MERKSGQVDGGEGGGDTLDKRSMKKKNKLGTLGRLFSKKDKAKSKESALGDLSASSTPQHNSGICWFLTNCHTN